MPSQQSQQSQASRSAARRRQRSTRLTVAVSLLAAAALLVGSAVVSGTGWFVSVAAVLAVVLGAAATRITHSELMASRRDAARDRAQQAADYAGLTARRTAENEAFAADMRRKILDREEAITALEQALSRAQKHAVEQTRKLNAEARRADLLERDAVDHTAQLDEAQQRAAEAIVRVAELEAELDVLQSELSAWKTGAKSTRSA